MLTNNNIRHMLFGIGSNMAHQAYRKSYLVIIYPNS